MFRFVGSVTGAVAQVSCVEGVRDFVIVGDNPSFFDRQPPTITADGPAGSVIMAQRRRRAETEAAKVGRYFLNRDISRISNTPGPWVAGWVDPGGGR